MIFAIEVFDEILNASKSFRFDKRFQFPLLFFFSFCCQKQNRTQPGGCDLSKLRTTYVVTTISSISGLLAGLGTTLFAGGRTNFTRSNYIKYVHGGVGGILGLPVGGMLGFLLSARLSGARNVDVPLLRFEWNNFIKEKRNMH